VLRNSVSLQPVTLTALFKYGTNRKKSLFFKPFFKNRETGKGAFLRRIAVLHMEQLPIDEKLEFTSITIVRLSSDGRGDTILTIGFKTGHIAMLELGAHKMNVRNCISFNGHPVSVIVPVTSQ